MTDEKRPNNFASRLERIEKTRQDQPPVTAEDLGIKPEPSPYHVPKERHFVRNSLIWLGILVAAGSAGYVGYQALPDDLRGLIEGTEVAAVEEVVEVDEEPEPPKITLIAETDQMSDHGATLQSPSVASFTSTPLTLTDIATQVSLPTTDTLMGEIIPFDRNVSCNLRAPLPTEKFMSVRLENGLLPAPVQAFSNAALAHQLLENVEAVTQNKQTTDGDGQIDGTMQTVDIFLTDSSAPIYLVLQNMLGGVLWNIHTAPDVTVGHIALVSENISGVVNPPAGTTIDGLLIGDFVTPYQIGDDADIRDCMVRPWRSPQPDWIAVQNIDAGNVEDDDVILPYAQGYAAYNAWFTDTFKTDAATNVIAPRDAAHVLVGPAPTTAIAYQELTGQDIHIMRTDNVIVGDAATRAQIVRDLHSRTLIAAVGGDIADLNPAAVERANQ